MQDYYWLAAAAAFAVSSFFSMACGALEAFSPARLESLALSERKRARANRCLERREDILFASQFCEMCSRALLAAALTLWALGEDGAIWAAAAIFLLALFFGGLLPRRVASRSPEGFLVSVFPLLNAAAVVLSPVLFALNAAEKIAGRALGLRREPTSEEQFEKDILDAVHDGEMEGVLEEDEKDMIESIIEFKDVDVAEIMTPRTDMVCLDSRATPEEARAFALKSGFSRIPVIDQYRDNVIGILYVKDLLTACGPCGLGDILRPSLFVPETKKIAGLLEQFRQSKVHMAIVLDEYGGVAGLVTIEDVLEEIVGEIEDEFDTGECRLVGPLKDGRAEVSARARVSEVNESLGINLPEAADYDTIGGLIFARLARIPRAGETLAVDNVTMTVLEADQRRIERVAVKIGK